MNASGNAVGYAWHIAAGDVYGRGALKFEPLDTIPGSPPDNNGNCASGIKHPATAKGISDGGLLVGDGTGPCNSGIYVSQWPGASITWLPPSVPSPAFTDEGCCINNAGEVAGWFSPTLTERHGGLWRPSGQSYAFTDLGTLNGDNTLAMGMAPNLSGVSTIVVGYSTGTNGTHAWSWQNGVMTPLPGDPTCGGSAQASDVTDAGVVVGTSCALAALWSGGQRVDLNAACLSLPIPGFSGSVAHSIAVTPAGRTVIVGSCGSVPVVWYNNGSGGYDAELLPLLVGDSDGDAYDVNGAGYIVGYSGCLFIGCGNDRKPVKWVFTPPPINHPPIANAGGPYAGTEGTAVSFNGSASADPDGTSLSYDWDFGDGSAHGSGATPTHKYTDNGSYNVVLTVSDGALTNAVSTTATVSNVAPTVTLTVQSTPPIHVGQNFVVRGGFGDAGTADGPWAYKFFRNSTLLQQGTKPNQPPPGVTQPVTLKINSVGTFTLRLEVTDKDGGVGSKPLQVQIVP